MVLLWLIIICWPSMAMARAEVAPVHKCDEVAAHPDDTQKYRMPGFGTGKRLGIVDKDIDPALAIKHCTEAVLKDPNAARFHFQLGRAYWLSENYKDAVDQFRQAAEMGHAAAASYLGEAYQNGRGGLKVDLEKASKQYQQAVKGGFLPAERLLANFRNTTTPQVKPSSSALRAEGLDNPAPSVWENGLPNTVPAVSQLLLTNQVLALFILKHSPEQFDHSLWRMLIKWQVDDDRTYYRRTEIGPAGGLEWGLRWDHKPNKKYHPAYIPFSPSAFFPPDEFDENGYLIPSPDAEDLIKSNSDALELFKQWTHMRAATLPDTLVLPGTITLSKDNNHIELRFTPYQTLTRNAKCQGPASGLDYASGQILVAQEGPGRNLWLVLPNLQRLYIPHVRGDDWVSPGARSFSAHVELEFKHERTELIDSNEHTNKTILAHIAPTRIRLRSYADGSILHDEELHVARRDAGRLDVSENASALDALEPSRTGVPFTAEIADLLIVKFLPKAVDERNWERMLMARWFYEEAISLKGQNPDSGIFFTTETCKLDAKHKEGMLKQFKEWSIRRTHALPTRIAVKIDMVRQDGQYVLLPDGISIKEKNSLRSEMAANLRKRELLLRKNQHGIISHSESQDAPALSTPSPFVFIGSDGHFRMDSGPRRYCGITITPLQDPYCQGSLNAIQSHLVGAPGMGFSDVIELDKFILAPSGPNLKLSPLTLELEVVGVTKQTERPHHPALKTLSKNFGGEGTGPYYLFKTQLVSARVGMSRGTSGSELELKNFSEKQKQ